MRRHLGTLFIVLMAVGAAAHDAHHMELTSWYKSLTAHGGTPCCDGGEATRLADVEWRSENGHYQVFLQGDWVDVPDKAIVQGPNLAGTTLVWPFYHNGRTMIRCFLPGTMG